MENKRSELEKRLIIQDASFLTTKEKIILQNNLDSSTDLALLSISEISTIIHRVLKRCVWDGKSSLAKARTAERLIEALGIGCTFYEDADFPAMLREMTDPPYAVFYRGNLSVLGNQCVSVVGTRRAAFGGRKAALDFGRDACLDGCTVVSGLAFGIDVASHKGALEALSEGEGLAGQNGGPALGSTVAVLPSGIDTIVPSVHAKVARRILEKGGALLSEYLPGTPALSFRFVQRDRLIAALSPATVVIQSPSGGGALYTAQFALDYGRDVLFHAEAFSAEARQLEALAQQKFKALAAEGKKVEAKMANSPECFVADGAPVIHTYAEYKACRLSAPGTFCRKSDGQQLLF